MLVIKQTFKMSLLVIKFNFLNVLVGQVEPSNMENGKHIHWTLGGWWGGRASKKDCDSLHDFVEWFD
jgi:hypothetical protein